MLTNSRAVATASAIGAWKHIDLPEAPFWTPAQAAFLRESLLQDTDWSQQVDQLSQALRGN